MVEFVLLKTIMDYYKLQDKSLVKIYKYSYKYF